MDLGVPQYNEVTKIWCGVGPKLKIDESLNVGEIILESLAKHGNKVIQINHDTGYTMTASEMRLRSIRIGQHLMNKAGVKSGDMIVLIARNNDNIASLMYACMSIGTPFMPLDGFFEVPDMIHMFKIFKPNMIFCELGRLNTVKIALSQMLLNIPIITFDKSEEEIVLCIDDYLLPTGNEDNFSFMKTETASKTIASVMCSSGTTGLPKGVIISHAQFACLTANILKLSMFTFSGIDWFSGMGLTIVSAMGGDLRVITKEKFSPALFLEIISKHKINATVSSPWCFHAILQDPLIETTDLTSLKIVFCGGSILSETLKTATKKYLPNGFLLNAYGSTEMAGMMSANVKNKPNAVGYLAPGTDGKIIDDNGKALPPNQEGEICFRKKPDFLGYYRNDEATRNADAGDGFVRTGDVGYFDDEGCLYIVDRRNDLMRYRGCNIISSSLERLIEEIESVQMACVIGVLKEGNDLPAVAIIKDRNSTLTSDEVKKYVAHRVQDSMTLRGGVYFFDTYPLTSSGKIMKRAVKEIIIKLYDEQNK